MSAVTNVNIVTKAVSKGSPPISAPPIQAQTEDGRASPLGALTHFRGDNWDCAWNDVQAMDELDDFLKMALIGESILR